MPSLREVLAGRYELLDVIGRGGMGVVYRARDRVLGRTVAVKVLPTESTEDPALVARFEREAKTAAALNHPNIVAVFDTGSEADTHFIVMEYVTGRSLAQLLKERQRPSPADAAGVASQVASALAAAHRAGIVHRDIKPANVMIDDAGHVKVLDFGIARMTASATLTHTAVVLGSAPYLAPEITRGETADARSDIYSLGCLLYELVTGQPPFKGEVAAAVMHQHNAVAPRPPRELNPEVPPALEAVILQMLAKQPEQRPQSASEVAAALSAASASTLPHPGFRPARRDAPTALTQPLIRGGQRRRRSGAIAAAALAVLALGALIALLASGGGRPRPPHTAAAAAKSTITRTTQTTASTPTKTTRTPAPPPPPTVPSVAGALTTLIAQDLQSGAIDKHGQDLPNHLQDILNSYDQGHADDALHKVDDLTKHLEDLSSHGDIQPPAAAAISAEIDKLRSALERSGASSNG